MAAGPAAAPAQIPSHPLCRADKFRPLPQPHPAALPALTLPSHGPGSVWPQFSPSFLPPGPASSLIMYKTLLRIKQPSWGSALLSSSPFILSSPLQAPPPVASPASRFPPGALFIFISNPLSILPAASALSPDGYELSSRREGGHRKGEKKKQEKGKGRRGEADFLFFSLPLPLMPAIWIKEGDFLSEHEKDC